ncbi:MAG: hypothetical protein ACRDIY_04055 [Chloroflexota bacterium]
MRVGVSWLLAPLFVMCVVLVRATPANATRCRFDQGFRAMHDLIPEIVGNCRRDAHFSPLTGDAFQETSGPSGAGGLLTWRRASNITSFTDGYRTWLQGPFGFQVRLNTQRFDWERAMPTPVASPCRSGDPLANVHDSRRLLVVTSCQSVIGVVRQVRVEDDGDVFVNLSLEAPERVLLNRGNLTRQRGTLVLEIVPADQPGCLVGVPPRQPFGTASFGICTGASLPTPAVGSAIEAIGPYVLDTNHGWMEIHPVWSLTPEPDLK